MALRACEIKTMIMFYDGHDIRSIAKELNVPVPHVKNYVCKFGNVYGNENVFVKREIQGPKRSWSRELTDLGKTIVEGYKNESNTHNNDSVRNRSN